MKQLVKKNFPTNLKLADVIPVFKKIDSTLAENSKRITYGMKGVWETHKLYKQITITIFMLLQKKVQYSICIDDLNKKMKDLTWSERIYRCSADGHFKSIWYD